jgi:hypothetical protein
MQNDLAAKACIECRRRHRKCDRLLPICTQCKNRQSQCEYTDAKRRGPKPYFQPYDTPQLLKTKNSRWISHNVALEILCLNVPIMEEQRLQQITLFIQNDNLLNTEFSHEELGLVLVREGMLL